MKRLPTKHRGFTLAELVLVIIVLAVLAGIVVPMLGGLEILTPYGQKSPEQIATEQTMRQVRDAIMGTGSKTGAWSDLGQRPETFAVLFADPNVLLSETAPFGFQSFDPVTRLGWRGPYLTGVSRLIDAWGNPFAIQIPDVNGNYARLVSAGPDGEVQTPPGHAMPPLDECEDDLVLFFRTADVRQ